MAVALHSTSAQACHTPLHNAEGKLAGEVPSSLTSAWFAPFMSWLWSRKLSPECQLSLACFWRPPRHKPLIAGVPQQPYFCEAGKDNSSDAELIPQSVLDNVGNSWCTACCVPPKAIGAEGNQVCLVHFGPKTGCCCASDHSNELRRTAMPFVDASLLYVLSV